MASRKQQSKEPDPKISMQCRICGDVARGLNFNVMSCMSCKSFFRRNAYKKKSLITQCQFDNNCYITRRTRSYCLPCRLKKCFELGMQPELIRRIPSTNAVHKKVKRTEKKHDQQINLPTPEPLGLLRNDRSTLTSYEWTLLSNVLHIFDEQNPSSQIRASLKKLSALPHKLRMKPSELADVLRNFYICIAPVIQQGLQFHPLPNDTRRVVVKHNMYTAGRLNTLMLCKKLDVFENASFLNACYELYGSDYMVQYLNTVVRCDPNLNLIKIMIFVLAFSSNCSIVKYNKELDISTASSALNLFHIQNIYATMLWKYLIYQDGFKAGVLHFTHLVKNIVDGIHMMNIIPQTEVRARVVDVIVTETEESFNQY